MDWPYHFTVSAAQKAARRQLLDSSAFTAQVSVLIPLLLIYLGRRIASELERLDHAARKDAQELGEKHGIPVRVGWGEGVMGLRRVARRVAWWMGNEAMQGRNWGTHGEFFWAGGWAAWLGWCVMRGVEDGECWYLVFLRF